MSQSENTIEIVITETHVTTFRLTPKQLEEAQLPVTAGELDAMDDDTLAVTLLDNHAADEFAVTDREIDITSSVAPGADAPTE
jgi:hypothetical protein